MNNWKKLEELVEQNQFELLTKDQDKNDNGQYEHLRLVYLMNDAVESFLVFRHASMNGKYIVDFEGEVWIEYTEYDERQRNYIILHQEENVVTIFFDQLDFEVYLFDYSQVGHFWVKGYEYLRQLEFKIAILHDKYSYIGEEACTDIEKILAALVYFPPLSYCAYPAVPQKYIVPRDHPWKPSPEAIAVMREIAMRAGDHAYVRWLNFYQWIPTKWMGKILAGKLHKTRHIGMVKLLMQCFVEGCSPYPLRYTMEESDLRQKVDYAKEKVKILREGGQDADFFVEEPFWLASDGLKGKVYLGLWKYGRRNTVLEIEEL